MWPRKCVSIRGFLCYLSVFGLPLVQLITTITKSALTVIGLYLGQFLIKSHGFYDAGIVLARALSSLGNQVTWFWKSTRIHPFLHFSICLCYCCIRPISLLVLTCQITTGVTNMASTKIGLYLSQFLLKSHGFCDAGYILVMALSALCNQIKWFWKSAETLCFLHFYSVDWVIATPY